MYDLHWAETRRQELFSRHTRATDFLLENLSISTQDLTHFLAHGMQEWEYFKFLIRMVELAANIRKKPNTTEHLNSERMFSALCSVLQNRNRWVPAWELTARKAFVTLREHECVSGEASVAFDREYHEAATGQLLLF